jgi:hypothetical protein
MVEKGSMQPERTRDWDLLLPLFPTIILVQPLPKLQYDGQTAAIKEVATIWAKGFQWS